MSSQAGAEAVALRVRGATKSFGANHALRDAGFELKAGHIHALLGGNGSGKSTLIKCLAGVQSADAGTVEIGGQELELASMTPALARRSGLHFVHQQATVFPELSVAENLAIGRGFAPGVAGRIPWRAVKRRAVELLERFHIEASPDDLLGDLNAARQTMVTIARALQDQEDASSGVLLLDEPTASLPTPEVELLFDALRRYAAHGQSIVFVTHRMSEIFELADEATILRDGQVVSTVRPAETTHDGLVELMMGRRVANQRFVRPELPDRTTVLEAVDLRGGALRGLSFALQQGEVVGLAGLMGTGRSSALRAVFGDHALDGGEIRIEGKPVTIGSPRQAMRLGVAHVPESRGRDAALAALNIRDNLSVTVISSYLRKGALDRRRERRETDQLIDEYLVKCASQDISLQTLSGGNQQKVILARWLRRDPRILLLDEPTQGVDVGSRAEIYELVNLAVAQGAAALVASSDFEELAMLCDRVLIMKAGRVVSELRGDDVTAERITALADAPAPALAG